MSEAKIVSRTVQSMNYPDKEVRTLECTVDESWEPWHHKKVDKVHIRYNNGVSVLLDVVRVTGNA